MAGGVSANKALRQGLKEFMQQKNGKVFYPRSEFCTDNGAMIAFAGCQRLLAGEKEEKSFSAKPRWPLEDLAAV